MAVLQAVTILVPMVSEKHISQLKFQQKLPIGTNRIKKKEREKHDKYIDPSINYQLIKLIMNYCI